MMQLDDNTTVDYKRSRSNARTKFPICDNISTMTNALVYQTQTPQYEIDDDLSAALEFWHATPATSVGENMMRTGTVLICAAALSHPYCNDCGCGHPEDDEPNLGH